MVDKVTTVASAESVDDNGINHQGPMCMALMVGKAGSVPDRPGGSKKTVEGRHAGTVCVRPQSGCPPATSSDVSSLVRLDLLGRTGLAKLRLRVRFGVTDYSANVERWPARAGLDLWSGGIE